MEDLISSSAPADPPTSALRREVLEFFQEGVPAADVIEILTDRGAAPAQGPAGLVAWLAPQLPPDRLPALFAWAQAARPRVGVPADPPARTELVLALPPALVARLRHQAEQLGLAPDQLATRALRTFLDVLQLRGEERAALDQTRSELGQRLPQRPGAALLELRAAVDEAHEEQAAAREALRALGGPPDEEDEGDAVALWNGARRDHLARLDRAGERLRGLRRQHQELSQLLAARLDVERDLRGIAEGLLPPR